ncbi:MAG: glycine cleavage system aminomethyltransferase GcvT [Candidatus Latescibacterota bacterium]|nr:MAG: glycine cleavage system aminomethyltransferase GcvT [Candidatus Latescibacterota bacterium]
MSKVTALHQIHLNLGAKMVRFAGWQMPVQYTSISEEHRLVRESAGLFDLSHMGEIRLRGKGAFQLAQRLVTNDLARLNPGEVLYAPMCNPHGGILDDLLVYRTDQEDFLLVVNAANTEKDYAWIKRQSKEDAGVQVENISEEISLIALQGPKAEEILTGLTEANLSQLPYYHFTRVEVGGVSAFLSRTGYTGEDGFELYIAWPEAPKLWNFLLQAGKSCTLKPIGLGARDTLRLEMGYRLWGNDIDETTSPFEAALDWTVKLNKGDFIGRKALEKQKKEGVRRRLVGFQMESRIAPRKGYPLFAEALKIGEVTSGSFSPTLQKGIGLGYVKLQYTRPGTSISVGIRGGNYPARIVHLPFCKPRVKKTTD